MRGDTLKLLVAAGLLLLVWGTLAPVGTLVWWLSQSAESLGLKKQEPRRLQANNPSGTKSAKRTIDCYVVYLPGVGDFSANQLSPGEEFFLNRIEQLHPNCVTVRDVFPYSVANKDLGAERFLAPVWKAAEKADGWLKTANALIKIRNLWRFAIAADDRYGVVYGRGIASSILDRMNAVHPIPQSSKQPINLILLGTSGGVQVALGAVPYLHDRLPAKLTVVSAGGAFDGEAGFNTVQQVYHLKGERDWVEDIPKILFSSRWSWTVGSPFNQAIQQGRVHFLDSGNQTHDGNEGYFGQAIVNGTKMTYSELTLQHVNQLPIWSVKP